MKIVKLIIILFISILSFSVYAVDKVDEISKAINKNDIKTVKELVEKGIDLETYNKYGVTLLMTAVGIQNKEIVLYLLSKGAKVNGRSKDNNSTPLLEAAQNGNYEIAKILIDNGADIHKFVTTVNPIHDAARNGNTKVVQLLLNKGVDVNIKDKKGFTPLIWAAGSGKIETTKLLIKYGADVNAGEKGKTALFYVKRNRGIKSESLPETYKKYEEIEKLLKEAGAKDVDMAKVIDDEM